jgi:hypothetical protein
MNKFKFEWQFMDGGLSDKVGSVEISRPKLSLEFEADSIDEVLRQVGFFLKGCSYEFEGEVGIINDFEDAREEESFKYKPDSLLEHNPVNKVTECKGFFTKGNSE